jgi:alpha-beta hydrolase superfamily lysophospholipase
MVLDTATNSKPTIFVIPGGACPVVFYNDLVSTLTKHGFEAETHNLRSYTDDPKNAVPQGLTEDAAYMHEKIETLVDQGKEVVVVGHSYGGLVTTDAAHGLSKAERAKAGKRGGIIRIIYLSCIVGAVGSNSTETCAGRLPTFDFMQPSEEVGVLAVHTRGTHLREQKWTCLADTLELPRTPNFYDRARSPQGLFSAIYHKSRPTYGFPGSGATRCVRSTTGSSTPPIYRIL